MFEKCVGMVRILSQLVSAPSVTDTSSGLPSPQGFKELSEKNSFSGKDESFRRFSHTIWLLGLKPVFFFFFAKSPRPGIKTTVVWSCIICLRWTTAIILTHFSSGACADPSLSKARRPRPEPPAAEMHSGMQTGFPQ